MYSTYRAPRNQTNVPLEQFYVWGTNCVNEADYETDEQGEILKVLRKYDVNMRRDESPPYNRYWLKVPPTWRTSEQKERIVGVRNIWLNEAHRRILFAAHVFKSYDNGETWEEFRYGVDFVFDNEVMLDKSFEKVLIDHNIKCYFEIDYYENVCALDFIYYEKDERPYIAELQFTHMSPDTCFVLNHVKRNEESGEWEPITETERNTQLIFPGIWNRKPIMATSSLATNTYKNEIGFSGVRYMPIKYFKLNSNQSEFWVDLWVGKYMLTPANLPHDGQDGISLELVFLHDEDDTLYT